MNQDNNPRMDFTSILGRQEKNKNLYSYEIGFWTHEESDYTTLLHEKKFTEDEMIDMIAEAIVEINDKDKFVHDMTHIDISEEEKEDMWKELKKQEEYHKREWFEDIYPIVISYLIENKGFKSSSVDMRLDFFGWANPQDKDSWEMECGKIDNKLAKKITKKEKE